MAFSILHRLLTFSVVSLLLRQTAYDVLAFTQKEKDNIYAIVASVMPLGEMKFKQKGRQAQAEADGTAVCWPRASLPDPPLT